MLLAAALSAPVASATPGARGRPTGPSPVAFSVEPVAGTWRVRWTLRNVGSAPVEVAVDRRLVWFEAQQTAPARGRRAPGRCVHDQRPAAGHAAVRTMLSPGQRYSELVDVRDTCALRWPEGIAPGATVTAHYGFAPATARTPAATWRARTVVLGALPYPVNDLTAPLTLAAAPAEPAEAATAPSALRVTGAPSQAVTGPSLVARVGVENATSRPLWVYYRVGQFSFELETPSGRRYVCGLLAREGNPFREVFVRLGPGGRRGAGARVEEFCPQGALDEAGVYRAVARYEVRSADAPGLAGQVFSGRAASREFALRVARGVGRYLPLGMQLSD